MKILIRFKKKNVTLSLLVQYEHCDMPWQRDPSIALKACGFC
ncbi:MAG: hypothetical protein ACOH2A_12760 [Sphingobacteriaceae bacterium]